MNLCITGANGQLGQTFRELAGKFPDRHFHFGDRTTADLGRPDSLDRWLADTQPDGIINCAAYTNVNRAETEPELARKINVDGVAHLARYCRRQGIPLLHYSSDYVYHTGQGVPFREEDPTQPKGVYAKTKLEGEQLALEIYPQTIIIRTSWVYAPYGHNFVKTMRRLGPEKEELRVVSDQIGTPTFARDLAEASLKIFSQLGENGGVETGKYGIFNYSNEGVCSWYDFALAIFELSGIDCRVIPVGSHEFPSPVERPHFSVMDKSKVKNTFGLEIPHWRRSLKDCLQQLAVTG